MKKHRCVVGIDLGTTHSALAYWYKGMSEVKIHEIEQIESLGQRKKSPILPSVVYLPHENEAKAGDLALPWDQALSCSHLYSVGRWAKNRGPEVPERFVSSAKSWLCNQLAHREDKILPWQSSIQEKISPVTAMQLYLDHLIQSFRHQQNQEGYDFSFDDIELVLTVPASFDDHARKLTQEAAKRVGFVHLKLLEEPQAAFYAWIGQNDQAWREKVEAGDLVLVCDVGGGTSDFSLIAVDSDNGELTLERVSVGRHLLLGGDNMDLSLAYGLKTKLESSGASLDRWQFVSLVNQVRDAKEKLFADESLEECQIAFSGKGSSLFAKSRTVSLSRNELEKNLLDGFFPICESGDLPRKRARSGFQELGLSYENDPAISHHLAEFLTRSKENCESNPELKGFMAKKLESHLSSAQSLLLPNKILFNGGVFKASLLKKRVLEVLQAWNQGAPLKVIDSQNLDLSVAFGAGYLGRSKVLNEGIRIVSGTAHSYYLGLESGGMAIPGVEPHVKGLCIVPQGTEEGCDIEMPSQQFGLQTGQDVVFRFFSSSVRAGDQVGCVVDDAGQLDETTSLKISLPSLSSNENPESLEDLVPVQLEAHVSDIGTLRLGMKHVDSSQRWDLEFNVRD